MVKVKIKSAQSILEYLITLTALVVLILFNTVGIKRGLQNNLEKSKPILEENIKSNDAPSEVKSEDYYSESRKKDDPGWYAKVDTYGGPQYDLGYYFHEGNTKLTHIIKDGEVVELKDNLILNKDSSYVAKKPEN
ncbi:MAG: hypothetical protein NC918_06085 [Candidatus Omnitrophica bacterium]|nr:hypothetical protein [Candidatus Omnitrophota bacterium]